jgi:hypothetical protein
MNRKMRKSHSVDQLPAQQEDAVKKEYRVRLCGVGVAQHSYVLAEVENREPTSAISVRTKRQQ